MVLLCYNKKCFIRAVNKRSCIWKTMTMVDYYGNFQFEYDIFFAGWKYVHGSELPVCCIIFAFKLPI